MIQALRVVGLISLILVLTPQYQSAGQSLLVIWFLGELIRYVFFRDRQSESLENKDYQTDIDAQTCNCPDFEWRKAHYPDDLFNRCCKHLRHEMFTHGVCGNDPLTIAIFSHPHPIGKVTVLSDNMAFACKENSPWVDVFAPTKSTAKTNEGVIDRYGYHIEEKRWSYGTAPKGALKIKQMIASTYPLKPQAR